MTIPVSKQVADMNYRVMLRAVYLDWMNNYVRVSTFAEHNSLTDEQARYLIDVARQVFNSHHPDA